MKDVKEIAKAIKSLDEYDVQSLNEILQEEDCKQTIVRLGGIGEDIVSLFDNGVIGRSDVDNIIDDIEASSSKLIYDSDEYMVESLKNEDRFIADYPFYAGSSKHLNDIEDVCGYLLKKDGLMSFDQKKRVCKVVNEITKEL